jgi:hypothetical protein
MIEIETKYNTGDVVTINEKDWTIEEIRMLGWRWVYELYRENKNDTREHCTIETSSLETLMGDDNGETSKETRI